MSSEIPPKVQNQLSQLQQLQQQAQMLVRQKSQIELSLREVDHALEALEAAPDDAVIYQAIGEVMIRSNRSDTIESLKEKKDTFNIRLKTLARQEERIQSRFTELQAQLKDALGAGTGVTAE
ncbi:MAG: prefoldin subunit beta [Methanosarcinales archaeon]